MHTCSNVETQGRSLPARRTPDAWRAAPLPDPIEQLRWVTLGDEAAASSARATTGEVASEALGWMSTLPPWLLMATAALGSAVLCAIVALASAALLAG